MIVQLIISKGWRRQTSCRQSRIEKINMTANRVNVSRSDLSQKDESCTSLTGPSMGLSKSRPFCGRQSRPLPSRAQKMISIGIHAVESGINRWTLRCAASAGDLPSIGALGPAAECQLFAAVIGDTFFSSAPLSISPLLSFLPRATADDAIALVRSRRAAAFIIAFHRLTIGTSYLRVSSTTASPGVFARAIMKRRRENAGPSDFELRFLRPLSSSRARASSTFDFPIFRMFIIKIEQTPPQKQFQR